MPQLDTKLLPDFCDNRVILLLILIGELLAIVLTLSRAGNTVDHFAYLGYSSLFIQCVALFDAALLCYLQKLFNRLAPRTRAVVIYLVLQLVTLAASFISFMVVQTIHASAGTDPHWQINSLLRNLSISAIITAVVMRYFYVRHQWAQQLKTENKARIEALQARIRPHFLFNSLNTIASLVHDHPDKAETAVLDLADLFRCTLTDTDRFTLSEELDITRRYLRIEELRLGERLQLQWQVADGCGEIHVPALIVQPLVENAIYHGIEPLAQGGCIEICVHQTAQHVQIFIANPYLPQARRKSGNQIALNNIRQRLLLAYGPQGQLRIHQDAQRYQVELNIPKTIKH